MKVYYSPYKLKFKDFNAKHISAEGLLFKFQKKNSLSYSLYHPIENLGDVSCSNLIKNFKKLVFENGRLSNILKYSLQETEHDQIKIPCYRLCKDFEEAELVKEENVKLKVSTCDEVLEGLSQKSSKRYILDANAQFDISDFMKLNECLPEYPIKYIEDPVKNVDVLSKTPIASDFINYNYYSFKIIKPTGFSHSCNNPLKKPVVVTSYLDHPLGQIIAAQYAQRHQVTEPCGLLTHKIFDLNAYSELFRDSSDFEFSDFTSLFEFLNKERWRELN
jgi:hypothetical protein